MKPFMISDRRSLEILPMLQQLQGVQNTTNSQIINQLVATVKKNIHSIMSFFI